MPSGVKGSRRPRGRGGCRRRLDACLYSACSPPPGQVVKVQGHGLDGGVCTAFISGKGCGDEVERLFGLVGSGIGPVERVVTSNCWGYMLPVEQPSSVRTILAAAGLVGEPSHPVWRPDAVFLWASISHGFVYRRVTVPEPWILPPARCFALGTCHAALRCVADG